MTVHATPPHGEATVRCPGCDCTPVGYAPHNGEGDCPPVTLDTSTVTCTTNHQDGSTR